MKIGASRLLKNDASEGRKFVLQQPPRWRVPLTARMVGALCTASLTLVAACFVAGCTTGTTPGGTVDASTGAGEAPNYEAILADRYSDEFPDDRVVTVRVFMKDADWAEMQANVRAKEYYKADIWIGDELVQDVAVRTKGSSSLMAAASAGTSAPASRSTSTSSTRRAHITASRNWSTTTASATPLS